jgi:hypothetical protein
MVDINIHCPSRDIEALQRAMARNGAEFRKGIPQQLKFAGGAIGRTLGTSTRVSDKHIALAKVNPTEARLLDIERRKGLQSFIGTKYFGSKPKQVTIFARGIAAARRDIRAQLYRRGLAKSSWRASIEGLPGAREVSVKGGVNTKTRQRRSDSRPKPAA